MSRILLLGANGQLGSDLKECLESSHDLIPLTRQEIDIAQPDALQTLETYRDLDYCINATAFTRVDDCEDSYDLAMRINAIFPRDLARFCQEHRIPLIHFSTDYVFDGTRDSPYTESDCIQPISAYGITKATGELAVRAYCESHYIFRVASLFGKAGASGKGGNFITTMLKLAREGRALKVIDDQFMSPTHTRDVAQMIAKLLNDSSALSYGTYHAVNSSSCSWYEFAQTIFELTHTEADLSPTDYDSYPTKAKRPKYSVLSNTKLSEYFPMPHWKEALRHYFSPTDKNCYNHVILNR